MSVLTTSGYLSPALQRSLTFARPTLLIPTIRHLQTTPAQNLAATATVPPHPKLLPDNKVSDQWKEDADVAAVKDYMLRHPVYTPDELSSITVTKRPIQGPSDWVAYNAVRLLRLGFDTFTNYSDKIGVMTEKQWLNRIIFLETVAGVPGMVGGMLRHMRSLRLLKRDNGWVHTLLEEAENERMHLLTFMKMKQPSPVFRFMVLMGQGVFFNAFFISYIISPRTCHRFVGYLEEEAVHTYSNALKDIEVGHIQHWKGKKAPSIAVEYWKLKEDAMWDDVVRAVRADEAEHRDVNHTLAGLKPDEPNPF
ncbi:hypothetical protein HK097_003947 [Rhizophlyctis rosea]|uniref:Alternative oxidase n=1 Tax=Rhizophlyctis rosea TaxID=64517 RepID=A0AAD5SHN1_9FUNG|nr:hypothetical protein HK097_003947 [Rhizophlyctis rosea]